MTTDLRQAAAAAHRLSKKQTLVGLRFGRLVVVSQAQSLSSKRRWNCLCDCGSGTEIISNALTSGHTQSCGCLSVEAMKKANTTHGMTRTKEYRAWRNMKLRCEAPSANGYKHDDFSFARSIIAAYEAKQGEQT